MYVEFIGREGTAVRAEWLHGSCEEQGKCVNWFIVQFSRIRLHDAEVSTIRKKFIEVLE